MITLNITWSDGKRMKGIQLGVTNRDLKSPLYRARLGREIIEAVCNNSGIAVEAVDVYKEVRKTKRSGNGSL